MTNNEKNELLDKLSICYNRINYLKIICEEKNKTSEAQQLEGRKSRLKLEIDGLLRDLYDNWIGDATQLKADLDQSNNAITECINKIEGDIQLAQELSKAIGYIDNIITLAAGLVI